MKALLFIAILALTLPLMAVEKKMKGEGKDRMDNGPHILRQLNLSESQREKIKALRKDTKADIKSSKKVVEALEAKLRDKLKSDESDKDLMALFSELSERKMALMKERFEHMLKIRDILDREQRQKFYDLREKMGKADRR